MSAVAVVTPVKILGASATAVTAPTDTAENTLATITIPAGAMGLNGIVRIRAEWSYTGSTNSKTLLVKFGGTAFLSVGDTAAANTSAIGTCQIHNRNSASSQRGSGTVISNGATVFAGTVQTGSIDTTAAVTILIRGTKALAGETLTLESYLVELITP